MNYPFKSTTLKDWAQAAGAGLILIALFHTLLSSWKLYSGNPLSDPGGYPGMARASRYFYDSGMREPIPVFFTKAALAAGAGDDASVRLAGSAVFAASVALTVLLAGRIYGPAAGMIAGLLLALNPYAGYYAVQGANNPHSGLFLMVFWFLMLKGASSPNTALFAGAAGGACALARLENLLIIFVILCLHTALERSGRSLKRNALIFAAAAVLASPYLFHQYRKFGTPVYSQAMAARFWINTERKGPRSGDRYEGGPLGLPEFLLRKNPAKAVADLAAAYAMSFFHYIPRLLHYKLLLAALLPGIFFIFRRKDYFTLLILPALILPIAFICTIDQVDDGSGIELRFFLNTLWLLCVYCAVGICGIGSLLAARLGAPAGAGNQCR